MRGGRNKFGPMYKRDRARKLQVMRQRQAISVHHNILGGSNTGSNSNPSPGSIAYTMSSSSSSLYTPPTLHIKQEIQIPQVTSMTSSPGSSPGPLAQQSGLSGLGAGLDHSQVLAQHTDPSTGGVQWQISSGNKVSQTFDSMVQFFPVMLSIIKVTLQSTMTQFFTIGTKEKEFYQIVRLFSA